MTTLSKNNFFRTSDGAYLYYQSYGAGIPLLLMHGWTMSSAVFKKNIDALTQKYQVITVDFRGHGYSSKGLHGHTTARYATDMHELLQYLQIRRFVLAGWSMGVTVALEYLRAYGEASVLGTVLIDGSCHPFTAEPWNKHQLAGYNMAGLIERMNDLVENPETAPLKNAAGWFKDKVKYAEAIKFFAAEIKKTPVWIATAIYNDYMMQDNTAVLRNLKHPVMIMVPGANVDRGKFEAEAPEQGELFIFDTKHALFYEDAANFNRYMLDFTDRIK